MSAHRALLFIVCCILVSFGVAPAKVLASTTLTGSCTATSGKLTLKASATRTSGISPLLVFFDATGTTDTSMTGTGTAFQDVNYSWVFGDGEASGKRSWAYGANAGHNSANTATGAIAAHLYETAGDEPYAVHVTAHNGSNTASCVLVVEAHYPAGASGFPGNRTTCVSSSGTPAAGSGGCPAGALTLKTSSFNTALSSNNFGSDKRVLFKCGDTFTGDNASIGGVTWSIGAYGGCADTTSNRPIMRDSGTTGQFTLAHGAGDGRITDLDFEGNGSAGYAINMPGGGAVTYQITLYNLYSNGNSASYMWSGGSQWALVNSVMNGMKSIGTFGNYGENNPPYSGANNINYIALLGNLFNGTGAPNSGSGIETVRISACRMCVISNNKFENANNVGAVLKIHSGNTYLSESTWSGLYSELIEISDNWFGGTSGSNLVETAPQNGSDDERLRNIVVERNVFSGGAPVGRQILVSAVNETVRDNVFFTPKGLASPPAYGAQVTRRGIEPTPTGVEIFNNTCYFLSGSGGQTCAAFDGTSFTAAGNNSVAKNNLLYTGYASGHSTVVNHGSGNTISNNTSSTSNNPSILNGTGSFTMVSDFKPTANYTGATTVPNYYDALELLWSNWELGALHP